VAELVTTACGAGKIELLQTHLQRDELMRDETRRTRTLVLPCVFVPTYGVVFGTSRPGLAQFGEAEKLDAIRSESGGHTNDALIAATAQHHGATLVTDDHRLTNRAKSKGITVWTSAEFIEDVRDITH
jgi:hypothetical protein